MTAAVLAELTARGVALELRQGRLVAGPPSSLTPHARALIRENLDALKDGLRQIAKNTWPLREQEGIAQWKRQWQEVWQGWREYLVANPAWQPPEPFESRCRIQELVMAWNAMTGQKRSGDEVLAHLSPEDFKDRELMTRGALALYVMTCLTS